MGMIPETGHDSALEWPGFDLDSETRSTNDVASLRRTCLRLVMKSSTVLPRRRRVALLDAYDEVQIGRDASTSAVTPRIRLKDMEVSKLHATLFWDRERGEWAVVDMGSKHGTFLRLSTRLPPADCSNALVCESSSTPNLVRLSPSKQASMPRPLRYLDELIIGGTVFVAHVHLDAPCDDCMSEGELDIPLFSSTSSETSRKIVSSYPQPLQPAHDPKTSISLLKKSLLSRHASDSANADYASPGPSRRYIDRSAKRRALHPYSRSDSPPGVSSRSASVSFPISTHTSPDIVPGPWTASMSHIPRTQDTPPAHSEKIEPPAPISDSNIGHRLLAKQGWSPGSALGLEIQTTGTGDEDSLGDARTFLVEPLQIAANVGKRGLGMRVHPTGSSAAGSYANGSIGNDGSWKEDSKRRRWDDVRKSIM
ncbi:hypothetical protein EW145_g3645 [Phellinidium pouzarii]|uniref:G-patch domain-containing protein n=1 Tax=Phellinidium pouzarii TaxID=167371 RepID=A0A4S4L7W0_9AGAM|nr:hypothetical protein EW145_g3645 [Phellinidium pouzarii]